MGILPTNEEQLALQLINRARQDPAGEMATLFATGDRDIEAALDFFNTSQGVARSQVANAPTVAPLAWNPQLAQSADTHNGLMIVFDEQSHNLPGEPGIGDRFRDAGYFPVAGAESVFAFSESVLYAHAGFYIDWGIGPFGIQDPAGHRDAMLNGSFTEVGIAYEAHQGVSVGPFVTTQHFGRPLTANGADPTPQIVGVAIADSDGDAFYDVGEGLGGVTVTAAAVNDPSLTFTTTTWESGGYGLSVTPDVTYNVTFSGAALGLNQSFLVTVERENVARDAIVAFSAISGDVPTQNSDVLNGTEGVDVVSLLAGDDIFFAGDGDDEIYGDDGDDTIHGQGGNDSLEGGFGDDILIGGPGDDAILGGPGLDIAEYDASIENYGFFQEDGTIAVFRTDENGNPIEIDVFQEVEVFRFTDQTVSEQQILAGTRSNGIVELSATPKAVVTGTSGSDDLIGSNGNDEIATGAGLFDQTYGMGGADTFVFADETSNGVQERDLILDFELGQDQLLIEGAVVTDWLQTSQGLILVLDGDQDVIYLRSDDIDLSDTGLVLG